MDVGAEGDIFQTMVGEIKFVKFDGQSEILSDCKDVIHNFFLSAMLRLKNIYVLIRHMSLPEQ